MKSILTAFFFSAYLVISSVLARRITVYIIVDDTFSATFAGVPMPDPGWGWDSVKTFTTDVEPGQHLFAMSLTDFGGAAWGSVSLFADGVFVGQTDGSGAFRASSSVSTGWNTDINYSDSGWSVISGNCATSWISSNVNGVSVRANGFWFPSCSSKLNTWYLRWKV